MIGFTSIWALTFVQMVYLTALLLGLILLFKVLESKWAFKPSKPHKWKESVSRGKVSPVLRKLERSYQDKVQFYNFWLQIERIKEQNVPGAFAELGVYKGESARVIHHMAPERKLLLFDTFKGFKMADLDHEPTVDYRSTSGFFKDTSLENCKHYIGGNEQVLFYPGHFPETVKYLPEMQFAFIHLDADLYKPTIEALHYFYPRLSNGGVILVHDFNHDWSGIRKAIEEFQEEVSEPIIEIPDCFGSAMIIKGRLQRANSISA